MIRSIQFTADKWQYLPLCRNLSNINQQTVTYKFYNGAKLSFCAHRETQCCDLNALGWAKLQGARVTLELTFTSNLQRIMPPQLR